MDPDDGKIGRTGFRSPPEVAAAAGLYVVAALLVVLTLTSLKSTEQFF
ncbi:MAG: hypothetical protein IIC08_03820 [Proteobacteria bacterium]|nr:hypothetical protein [Pseudomonadota bacterium]